MSGVKVRWKGKKCYDIRQGPAHSCVATIFCGNVSLAGVWRGIMGVGGMPRTLK